MRCSGRLIGTAPSIPPAHPTHKRPPSIQPCCIKGMAPDTRPHGTPTPPHLGPWRCTPPLRGHRHAMVVPHSHWQAALYKAIVRMRRRQFGPFCPLHSPLRSPQNV